MKTFREITGSDLEPDEHFDFDTRYVRPLPTRKEVDHAGAFPDIELPPGVFFDEWGIGMVPTELEIPDYKYHPLAGMTTVREIEDFDWPDLEDESRYLPLRDKIEEFHRGGYAVSADMYQTIFETGWLMRGMEDYMPD
ncbi:MAG: hypothetical protein WCQ50_15980 [Spirochaetota bacterium]